jgi:hypothetical protein
VTTRWSHPRWQAIPGRGSYLLAAAPGKTFGERSSRAATTVVSSTGERVRTVGSYDYRRGSVVLDESAAAKAGIRKWHVIVVFGVAYMSAPSGKYTQDRGAGDGRRIRRRVV